MYGIIYEMTFFSFQYILFHAKKEFLINIARKVKLIDQLRVPIFYAILLAYILFNLASIHMHPFIFSSISFVKILIKK
jgi:hypothetical protein